MPFAGTHACLGQLSVAIVGEKHIERTSRSAGLSSPLLPSPPIGNLPGAWIHFLSPPDQMGRTGSLSSHYPRLSLPLQWPRNHPRANVPRLRRRRLRPPHLLPWREEGEFLNTAPERPKILLRPSRAPLLPSSLQKASPRDERRIVEPCFCRQSNGRISDLHLTVSVAFASGICFIFGFVCPFAWPGHSACQGARDRRTRRRGG